MTLLDVCTWIENSSLLVGMRSSPWLFPFVATIHLFGLALVGGSVLVVDLRLLGLGLRRPPLAQLAGDAERWLLRGLLLSLPTGVLLFMCFATKYYYLTAFWTKMASLLLVLLFTFSVRRRVTMSDEARSGPAWTRLVAVVSLSLWTSVAIGGRLIGFP